ncbi:hypothetical protein [uncultured Cohaesibacter sp.]|uniref:hypothetical protein n=1 Tax=uncultured Cohaesibacter sp. TaxID=1002546 RepID=UPI0029C99135|nr:hypothetical protein [uncultured Cohaesibacter sp.]
MLDDEQGMAAAVEAGLAGEQPEQQEQKSSILRDQPTPEQARAALVHAWESRLIHARSYWDAKAFKRMREDMRFAAGHQWPDTTNSQFVAAPEESYVANITLRHIQQRTASIYGKNPKIVARRRERMLNTVWDGSMQQLQQAMQTIAQQQAMGAMIPDPNAMAVIADAQNTMQQKQMQAKIAKTLELLFEHEISEQPVPFKVQMKATVRRTLTTGVGYIKLGYQRVMEKSADVENQLNDMAQQLAAIERLSADIQDGEATPDGAEAEQLRLAIASLEMQPEILIREGLLMSYPSSTAIIPDPNTKQLRGFVGSNWVAEEFYLSSDEIKETYRIDVGSSARTYKPDQSTAYTRVDRNEEGTPEDEGKTKTHCVWEIFNKEDGLVYVVCDGYADFLREPAAPDIWMERFFPWFPLVFNELCDEETIFPLSDVSLMRNMQMELNRARQGLREHRTANRPKTFVRAGALSDDDKDAIIACKANEVIELEGLAPGEKVGDLLQPHEGPPIDQRLYDPSPVYDDYLRTLGQQEANLGGTSNATATEASIAEGSRVSGVSSVVDDLDEFLTEVARAAGQILLLETSKDTVMQAVGPGAVWPDLSRDEVAREIHLEVEAASTGRPNQAQEIQNAQQVFPLLMQIPGLSPEWLASELLRRLDDRLDIADAFSAGMPSVQMMNRLSQMTTAQAGSDPNEQGAEGGNNAPGTQPAQVNAAPRAPEPAQQTFSN